MYNIQFMVYSLIIFRKTISKTDFYVSLLLTMLVTALRYIDKFSNNGMFLLSSDINIHVIILQ